MALKLMSSTQMTSHDVPAYPETADIETSSDDYATRFSGEVGRWFLKVQEDATTEMLRPYTCPSIVDVGGGHGQLTKAFLKQGSEVTILGSAESCRKRVEPYLDESHCWFVRCNLIALPFPKQHFDVSVSYRLLPHCDAWKQLVAELCRVAKHAVIIDYPDVKSMNAIAPVLFQWKKGLEKNTRPFTCFRTGELIQEFGLHGFRLADRYPEFFLPMVLHRALKRPRLSIFIEGVCRMLGLTALFGSPVILKFVRNAI